jgi:hypothetical protein
MASSRLRALALLDPVSLLGLITLAARARRADLPRRAPAFGTETPEPISRSTRIMRNLSFAPACLLLLLGLTASGPALAYIGPGAGITMLSALWGVVVAVLLAIGAVLFWPIRALMRRFRKGAVPAAPTAPAQNGAAAGAREKTAP